MRNNKKGYKIIVITGLVCLVPTVSEALTFTIIVLYLTLSRNKQSI